MHAWDGDRGNADHKMVGPNHQQLNIDSQEFPQTCILKLKETKKENDSEVV